ncbi:MULTISPECIES: hypothetical protein [unclassified Amycolatopsis]|uniref:hypothetical protein n=1 Tax=unclassified Amycolatopsis TaxID=2618356 RepID=UPI001FF36D4A|nr:hypothetical protein [Amycolatopsis sp. FBCC-B4732]UOX86288.1 hypothetical protein MUY14_31645 [Amycolatopsis sp. FBCC-B4732]
METALTLAIGGVVLLVLSILTAGVLAGRRVRRGRKRGRYPYRAKPNGTYDNSTHTGMS